MGEWDEYSDYVDGPKASTNPTHPNADELEVVATAWKFYGKQCVDLKFAPDAWHVEHGHLTDIEPLVTLSSAQAQIDALREANEALMKERASLIETKRAQIEMLLSTIDRCRMDAFVATAKAEASAVEVDRMREALEPFADWVRTMEANEFLSGSHFSHWSDEYHPVDTVELGDFRRARSALSGGPSSG